MDATTTEDVPAGPMTLYVCTTCRDPSAPQGDARPGSRLHAALAQLGAEPLIDVVPVECLSVCRRPCTIALAAPGKWTYVVGDLAADTSAETVRAAARLYAEAKDGIIPWKLRPDAFKRGVVSRTPPLTRRSAP